MTIADPRAQSVHYDASTAAAAPPCHEKSMERPVYSTVAPPMNDHVIKPPDKVPVVEDVGLILRMILPKAWQELQQDFFRAKEDGHLRIFALPERGAKISLTKFGVPVDKDAHNALVLLLGKEPHLLHFHELPSLSSVIHPLISRVDKDGRSLVLLSAKTCDVNGKRVLLVDGTYQGSDCHILSIFWNASMSSFDPRIQHATFEGRGIDYLACLSQVKVTFKTLQWKTF